MREWLQFKAVWWLALVSLTVPKLSGAPASREILQRIELESINKLTIAEGIEEDEDGLYVFIELGFRNANSIRVALKDEQFRVSIEGFRYTTFPFPQEASTTASGVEKDQLELGTGQFVRLDPRKSISIKEASLGGSDPVILESGQKRSEKTVGIRLGDLRSEEAQSRLAAILALAGARPHPFHFNLEGTGKLGWERDKSGSEDWIYTDRIGVEFHFKPKMNNNILLE